MLGNGFQPVFRFHSTRPINNPGQIAATTHATPPLPKQLGRITTPVCFSATSMHTEVRSKSTNVSKNLSKTLVASQKTRESAIHDIQHSSDLESALLRFLFIDVCHCCCFLLKTFLATEFSRICWFLYSKSANISRQLILLRNFVGL